MLPTSCVRFAKEFSLSSDRRGALCRPEKRLVEPRRRKADGDNNLLRIGASVPRLVKPMDVSRYCLSERRILSFARSLCGHPPDAGLLRMRPASGGWPQTQHCSTTNAALLRIAIDKTTVVANRNLEHCMSVSRVLLKLCRTSLMASRCGWSIQTSTFCNMFGAEGQRPYVFVCTAPDDSACFLPAPRTEVPLLSPFPDSPQSRRSWPTACLGHKIK